MLNRLPNYLKTFGFRVGCLTFMRIYWKHRTQGALFSLPFGSHPIWIRKTPSDTSIFFQVLVKREYDTSQWAPQHTRLLARYQAILAAGHTPVIVDAGANIGLASRWFGERYPKAAIFAVEPDAANVAVLRRNVAHLANVTVLEGAVWDSSGRLSIGNPDAGAGAFRVIDNDGDVRSYTIAEIVALTPLASLFITKIDIEGGEEALFRSHLEWARDVELIVIETHDWLLPAAGTSRNFRRCIADLPIDLLFRGENVFCFRTS